MQQSEVLVKYYKLRYKVFNWRYNTNILSKIILIFLMACITGLAAQVKFYLPWTPVPVTGQTFAVLMSGIILGAYWGGFSQLIYILIGIAGIPWFAGATSGMNIIFGPTGGYLIGFIFASFFLGYFTDKYVKSRKFFPMLLLMIIANFGLIFIPGLLQLGLWLKFVKGTNPGLWNVLMMGFIPFIPGAVLKILLVSGITKIITPKKSYNLRDKE